MSERHFVPLHLHTESSLLDGAMRTKELVQFAQEQQWKAVGISDHGNVFGAVKFFKQAKAAGIKPILGCEMYLTPDASVKNPKDKYHHILLIVKDKQGYENLCQLMSFSFSEGYYFKPRIDYSALKKYNAGLIASTACLGGHIPRLLRHGHQEEAEERIQWFLDVFGPERFRFEIMQAHDSTPEKKGKQEITNDKILEMSTKYGVDVLATCDSHYLRREDREAHEVMLCIQTKDQFDNPNRFTFGDFTGHVRTTAEMLEEFKGNESAVWNTGKVADMCEFEFEFGKRLFPVSEVPENFTQDEYFKKLCRDGLEKRKAKGLVPKDKENIYDERLDTEMDLIIKMGFPGYFLIVGDFIDWAKKENIAVGPGRGSAAGSIVAWSLQITNIDPMPYNLLFERFLNPERISMPDIDIDFCIERREDVINYVKERYGHECVCQIITFGTMMAKGVIKDVARAIGISFQDSNAITDLIPDQLKITLDEALEQEPRLRELVDENAQVKKLFDIAKRLEGLTRHASKHACGVVISPRPLREIVPLYIPARTNELVTQYPQTELEELGFLKMDFLGLKNLTVIEYALKNIEKNHGVKIDLDTIPMDEPRAYKLFADGKSSGIFQFEADGVTEIMRKLEPQCFEDLIAVNALNRPGPLGSGMVDDFIDRRHGRKKTTYMFKELEPVLKETYGVIAYQEQVMKVASVIAGYTLGQADILRRAMGKKKVDVMEQQKIIFTKGAVERGFDRKKSEELFTLLAHFAGYGFNKSHSAAYSLISYQTAYLKALYPREFTAALLSFETSDPDKFSYYLHKTKELDIKVKAPDINRSEMPFSAHDDGILFGLKGIKSVGETAIKNILEEREKEGSYKDLYEFCKRVDLRTSNKRVIENLIAAGAMDPLPGNRAQKSAELEKIMSQANDEKEREKTGQMGLFLVGGGANDGGKKRGAYTFEPLEDWNAQDKLTKEKEIVGFYLSEHPLDQHKKLQKLLGEHTFTKSLEKVEKGTGSEPLHTSVALMQSHKVIMTKKGDRMAFAQFEDATGDCEVILFPRVFAQCEQWLGDHTVFVVHGVVDAQSQGKCKIKADELIPAEKFFEETKKIDGVTLKMPDDFDEAKCEEAKNFLESGSLSLSLNFKENDRHLSIATKHKVKFSTALIDKLNSADFDVQITLGINPPRKRRNF
ncbi:DNA polymerase III subunit alpha [bacterium]|nr:DNA polymerase III subunit alpha [bacterium]